MVELQIINKVLKDKSNKFLVDNNVTEDYFDSYSAEYKFILDHLDTYKCVPDNETFIAKFPDFEFILVSEPEDYLVSTLREEYVYRQALPMLNTLVDKMQVDSYEAVDYLSENLQSLKVPAKINGIDIIKQARDRYDEYLAVSENHDDYFIETGFEELDDVVGGWHRGEELVVVFSRTGNGKTWVTLKMIEHAWNMNNHVTILEPEMTANKIGYRFDTLHQHISNTALLRGDAVPGYEHYIDNLSKSDVPIEVLHPTDFNRNVTVQKLKTYCASHDTDILLIDGITYLSDSRKERGDNRTTQLTHISEDLMDLSIELKIPVIIVCQANREGAKEEDLQLENIRDSDGIAYNASMVLSIMRKDPGLVIALNKARNSANNVKLTYLWDIDTGMFSYIPSSEDEDMYDDAEYAENLRRQYSDTKEEY